MGQGCFDSLYIAVQIRRGNSRYTYYVHQRPEMTVKALLTLTVDYQIPCHACNTEGGIFAS